MPDDGCFAIFSAGLFVLWELQFKIRNVLFIDSQFASSFHQVGFENKMINLDYSIVADLGFKCSAYYG